MWRVFNAALTQDAQEAIRNEYRRAQDQFNTATQPFVDKVTETVDTVQTWIWPIPSATEADQIRWKRKITYHPFIHNLDVEIFPLFENNSRRDLIDSNHVFCALHHPGIGLDLCVLFGISLDPKSTQYMLNHYVKADLRGTNTKRLCVSLCRALNRHTPPSTDTTYEQLISKTFKDTKSLLHQIITADHYTALEFDFPENPNSATTLKKIFGINRPQLKLK